VTPAEWAEILVMDEDGYPNDEAVEALETVEVRSFADCEYVLDTLQSVWRWPSYFTKGRMRLSRRRWHVSTGGWSGHESLLFALERNWWFWMLAYESHRRGGHYVFETKRDYDPR
jgi:hypothetical protein